jgi:hypothetical protein
VATSQTSRAVGIVGAVIVNEFRCRSWTATVNGSLPPVPLERLDEWGAVEDRIGR